jgi:predicted AlkP superfamily phosphohydrolase/phosphomutase
MLQVLDYINEHFDRVFVCCYGGDKFIPPTDDARAIIVMNEIVKLVTKHHINPHDIEVILSIETVQQIVRIKCKEYFQDYYHLIDEYEASIDNFIKSFYSTITDMVGKLLDKNGKI